MLPPVAVTPPQGLLQLPELTLPQTVTLPPVPPVPPPPPTATEMAPVPEIALA